MRRKSGSTAKPRLIPTGDTLGARCVSITMRLAAIIYAREKSLEKVRAPSFSAPSVEMFALIYERGLACMLSVDKSHAMSRNDRISVKIRIKKEKVSG